MVKYCLDKYPIGSFPYQKSPGKFLNDSLYENISILAENIVRDMTFLGMCFSSTLEVGTGKSVLVQEIGEAYTEMVNKLHGLDIAFDVNNIVFHPKDLIETALKLPKYSCIVLDEWEDAHYWSELGITLRQFFRKCRQLNLFMIVIIPNFFQMPQGYAISRSVFAIDVKFLGEFERGYFDFYSFKKKKELYIKGKKNYDYDVVKRDFDGTFTDGYAVGREAYLTKKRLDLQRYDKEEKKKLTETEIKQNLFHQIYEDMEDVTIKRLAKAFGTSERTGKRWLSVVRQEKEGVVAGESATGTHLINNLYQDEIVGGEEEKAEEKVEEMKVDGVDQIAPHTNRQVVVG